jgi:16S rRNA (uracil1498-N3)-methyltransferase
MKHIPRFFLKADLYTGREISLLPNQMHHASSVLRLSVGGTLRVFNSEFGEWNCEIVDVKKRLVKCISIFKENKEVEGPVVACALINPKRFDFFLEKATELGVGEVIPIASQYSNYKSINLKKAEQKIIQACEQSHRLSVPILQKTMKIEDFLQKYSRDHRILVGDEKFSRRKSWDLLKKKSVVLIGPEGGFSEEEYNLFDIYEDLYTISLGPNILRSETAALAIISIWGEKFL